MPIMDCALRSVKHRRVGSHPQAESVWDYHESIHIAWQMLGGRMFPLALEGLDRGMKLLSCAY